MKLPLSPQTPTLVRLSRGKLPSTDGLSQRHRNLTNKVIRPHRKPVGHRFRPIELSETVDELMVYAICSCQKCGTGLQQVTVKEWHLSQVHEISPRQVRVIEHQAQVKTCPHCGASNQAEFSPAVNSRINYRQRLAGVHYGERLKRLMVYLIAA